MLVSHLEWVITSECQEDKPCLSVALFHATSHDTGKGEGIEDKNFMVMLLSHLLLSHLLVTPMSITLCAWRNI